MRIIIGFLMLIIVFYSCESGASKIKKDKKITIEKKDTIKDVPKKVVSLEPFEMDDTEIRYKVEIDTSLSDVEVDNSLEKIRINTSIKNTEVELTTETDIKIVKEEIYSDKTREIKPMVILFNHLKFDELLKKHVSESGVVNYESFKKEEYKLNQYLKMLASVEPKENWTRNKKLAYYINLYNASTVSLILDNYPLKSIKDITQALEKSFIKIGSKNFSLNELEDNIIRSTFKEPKIHFAINCATVSCPKLSNSAFSEKNIDRLLKENTERFLKNTLIGVSKIGNKVELSRIFDWYVDDFGGEENLLNWITSNSDLDLSDASFKSFKTYDWELNNK